VVEAVAKVVPQVIDPSVAEAVDTLEGGQDVW
jgi:hypothetical protein